MTPSKRRNLSDVLAQTAPETTPPPAPVVEAEEQEKPRKFTMLVDAADDDRAHRVVDDVLKRARIRPTKSMRADVVRVLFKLADIDDQLRERVARMLRDSMEP